MAVCLLKLQVLQVLFFVTRNRMRDLTLVEKLEAGINWNYCNSFNPHIKHEMQVWLAISYR